MAGSKSNLYTCLWLMYLMTSCNSTEPHCSKFPYEEALLEKLVRLEFKVEQMDSGIRAVQDNVLEQLKKEKEDNVAFRKQLEEEMRENSNKTVDKMDSGIRAVQDNFLEELKNERQGNVAFRKQLEEQMRENYNKMLQEFAEVPIILFRARDVSNLTPSSGETMIYTNVMTNQGSGYNSANGIFTAPIADLYLFSAQFCIDDQVYFNFAFYVGAARKQATSIASPKADCITSVMPIELKKSSKVRVKSISGGYELYSTPNRWNIFSGVLVRPINND